MERLAACLCLLSSTVHLLGSTQKQPNILWLVAEDAEKSLPSEQGRAERSKLLLLPEPVRENAIGISSLTSR